MSASAPLSFEVDHSADHFVIDGLKTSCVKVQAPGAPMTPLFKLASPWLAEGVVVQPLSEQVPAKRECERRNAATSRSRPRTLFGQAT